MRKRILLAIGLALGVTLGLVQRPAAHAHAVMLAAAPNPNGLFPVDDPPERVQITFSEEITPAFSTITVLDQTGQSVVLGGLQLLNPERTIVAVSLTPLQAGTYTVAWNALSAVDGHTSSGSYVFGVGVAPATQVASTSAETSPASLVARWLTIIGQILLVGVFAFQLFVWRPILRPHLTKQSFANTHANTQREHEAMHLDLALARQVVRAGWVGLGLVALGLLLTLLVQREIVRTASGQTLLGQWVAWLGTRFGGMWSTRFWLSAGLAFSLTALRLGLSGAAGGQAEPTRFKSAARGGWVWWAGLVLSAALGLTITLTSHSAALQQQRPWAVLSDAAHLFAAGVWVGGLVQLFIATRRTRGLLPAIRSHYTLNLAMHFSTVAAIAVGALLVSGSYLAAQHLGTWAALFKTTYGRILLAKVGLAVPAFAIASVNLFVVKPRLAAATATDDDLHRRFHRLVRAEAGFALAVVVAAGFLSDVQPGRDALRLAEQARATASRAADDLQVKLTIEPAQWGQNNRFDIYVLDAQRKPLVNARQVSLHFTFLDRPLGASKMSAEPVGDGHYRATGAFLSLAGAWQLEVAIRRPDAYDSYAAFQFSTTPEGLIRSLESSSATERLTNWLSQAGVWLAAGALIMFSLAWVVPAVLAVNGKISIALAVLLLPSLIAMGMGVRQLLEAQQGAPVAPPSDPRALAWLAQSDVAMNRLSSVQLLRTTRGDSGAVITETISFQAPNLFHDRISNGAENMAQGAIYYYRQPGENLWQAVRQNEPFTFPQFDLSQQAVSVRMGKIEEADGQPTQQVLFTVYLARNPVSFVRWIDMDTKLILREYMDAPGHYMLSIYHSFDQPASIRLPAPSEIGPPPTMTIPQP